MREKKEIAEFMVSNPKDSLLKVAGVFSERYERDISKQAIWRLTQQLSDVISAPMTSNHRIKIRSKLMEQFEDELYEKINTQLSSTPLTLSSTPWEVKLLGMNIQAYETFKNNTEINKLQFSNSWWRNFRKERNIRFKKTVQKL